MDFCIDQFLLGILFQPCGSHIVVLMFALLDNVQWPAYKKIKRNKNENNKIHPKPYNIDHFPLAHELWLYRLVNRRFPVAEKINVAKCNASSHLLKFIMSDVPHLKIHSIDKNVLGTKSATSSVDFLLKGLPPFWLQRLWQVCNRVLIAADLRRAIADRLRISDLPKFILLSTLYILYRLKLRLPRNNPSPSIRTGENLVLRKTYFLKDFLTGRRALFINIIMWCSQLVFFLSCRTFY